MQGKTFEQFHAEGHTKPHPIMFLQVFLYGVIIAYVVAVIETHFVNLIPVRGAMIGVLLWLVAGATSYGTALFSYSARAVGDQQRPQTRVAVDRRDYSRRVSLGVVFSAAILPVFA